MTDKFTTFMNHEIAKVNLHLPTQLLNLALVEKMETPGYRTRKKDFVAFEKEELEFIKEHIPRSYYRRFELPIYLTRRRNLGGGIYVVGGSDVNLYIIKKILNPDLEPFDIWRLKKLEPSERYIYNYQLPAIRRKLRTTTVQAFT